MTAERKAAGKKELELFLLSAVSLYLELLVIRWMSADFRAFTVFKTFPLVTCFIGLGLGYALADRRLFRLCPWSVVIFVAVIQLAEFFGFWHWVFPSVSVFHWQSEQFGSGQLAGYLFTFILLLIIVLSAPFAMMACLGARLGELFNDSPPLRAYCINIAGSIFGSLIFSIVSFLGFAPWLALVPATASLCFYAPEPRIALKILPFLVCLPLSAWNVDPSPLVSTYWTPYQRLDTFPFMLGQFKEGDAGASKVGLTISANGHFYQHALDLTAASLKRLDLPVKVVRRLEEHARNYNLPYLLTKPRTILILGAGSGNDVAAALRNGAEHVDAVDIDPIIIRLGIAHHPEHPYDSARVRVICDDARDFLNNCKTRYDLIIFAGLDSQTVTGKGASVRLDNYVYTKQSLEQALRLLNDDGLMVLSFCKSRDWLSLRLFSTIKAAAGFAPLVLHDTTAPELPWEIYLSGPRIKNLRTLPPIEPFAASPLPARDSPRILTDDWPFIYVTPVDLDLPYLLVVSTILFLAFLSTRRILLAQGDARRWQMFFLGAAFLLLELQAIARLSLLYGSTWLTSAVVINGILLMILAANFLVIALGAKLESRQNWLYLFLALSLSGSYLLPFQDILCRLDWLSGHAVVTAVTLLPLFAAGLIFAVSFRTMEHPGSALAFNLLGAVVGAMLEYASNYTGIGALVIIAAALYLLSYLCLCRQSGLVMPDSA